MTNFAYVEKLVNLIDPAKNILLNCTIDEAESRVGNNDVEGVRAIDGQFALVQKKGNLVRMARSLGRPMRYFLAKQVSGPLLIIAERIDEIAEFLKTNEMDNQFHPSYTRMVPAHYITELALLGCPDPNPKYARFLPSVRDALPADLREIGKAYVGAIAQEIDSFLDRIPKTEPIGVLFSGGADSGTVLALTYHALLRRGESPARLKAFTLTIDNEGTDGSQASEFLKAIDADFLLETIDVKSSELDFKEAVALIEDYKPLDVQAAVMANAICKGIRQRYPDWKYLLDGDGGDENLRDYPIEENSELTIRSVLSNPFFYHEGWGVEAVKHSLTYTGGQSRGHVRSYAPASRFGFTGFSPMATPNVVRVAEGIPFIELTQWSHDKLYRLKGEVCRLGVDALTGISIPIFEKKRFQRGAISAEKFDSIFPAKEIVYRRAFAAMYESANR